MTDPLDASSLVCEQQVVRDGIFLSCLFTE